MTDVHSLIWGRRSVLEAVKRDIVLELFVGEGQHESGTLREITQLAGRAGVIISRVSERQLGDWTHGERAQGVAARVKAPTTIGMKTAIEAAARSGTPPFFLLLDQIQDPHNVGALLRTANAAGVHAVVFPERRSAPLSGVVAKVSAGALHHVSLVEAGNLRQTLDELRRQGIWIVGLDENAPQSIYRADLRPPIALVMGGEGEGLRPLTRKGCDYLVSLPMFGAVGSLNVSVAGGVAMYEVVRQRSMTADSIE